MHQVKVFRSQGCNRVGQIGATCVGPVCRLAYTCRSCICNAQNAVILRHGVEQPVCTRQFSGELWADVIRSICFEYDLLLPWFLEHWLDRWPKGKCADIRRSQIVDAVIASCLKAFVKRECGYNLPSKARLIQGYINLATQALFGPEFACLQKAATRVFCGVEVGCARVWFGSGMDYRDLGAWMDRVMEDFGRPVFYERDGKNWDATQNDVHHAFKLRFYDCAGDAFVQFVESGFAGTGYVGRGEDFMKYRLTGTVKSGHNDTTLGNSLVNAGILVEMLNHFRVRGYVLVAGDDALVAIDGDYPHQAFVDFEASFGICPVARRFDSPFDVSFISGVWYFVDGMYMFGPKIGRQLAKLWWTVHPPSTRAMTDYRYSVACCLAMVFLDFPFFRTYLPRLLSRGKLRAIDKFKVTPFHSNVFRIQDQRGFRFGLCRRYGVTMDDLDRLDAIGAVLPLGPCYVVDPAFDAIMEVDLADCPLRSCSVGH